MKDDIRKTVLYLGIIFVFILLLRLPLVDISFFFSVDEGVNAVIGNSILDGGIVYRDTIDHRGPITSYIYAFIFLLFGRNNMLAMHIVLIFLVFSIAAIIYAICALIGKRTAGFLSALFFSIFSYTYEDTGMLAFHTEWVAAFFSVIGAYLFLRHIVRGRYSYLFLSGVSFGLAFFSKQTALTDYAAALLCYGLLCYMDRRGIVTSVKGLALSIAGFSLVAAVFVGYFYINNALKDFLFCFWRYNTTYYMQGVSIPQRMALVVNDLLDPRLFFGTNYLLLIFFVAGSLITVLRLNNLKKISREVFIDLFLLVWGLFAYIGVYLPGRNFPHYYIMILPAFCLIGGITILSLFNTCNLSSHAPSTNTHASIELKAFLVVIIIIGLILPLARYHHRLTYVKLYIQKGLGSKVVPQIQMHDIASYIKNNSNADETIFVWGFFPQIYVFADRKPASRYITCNFLTGMLPFINLAPYIDTSSTIVPGSWEIFMDEIKNKRPIYIVDTSIGNYNYYGKYPIDRFEDLSAFVKENYKVEKIFFEKDKAPLFRLFKRIE
jgi:hypothetical protein